MRQDHEDVVRPKLPSNHYQNATSNPFPGGRAPTDTAMAPSTPIIRKSTVATLPCLIGVPVSTAFVAIATCPFQSTHAIRMPEDRTRKDGPGGRNHTNLNAGAFIFITIAEVLTQGCRSWWYSRLRLTLLNTACMPTPKGKKQGGVSRCPVLGST